MIAMTWTRCRNKSTGSDEKREKKIKRHGNERWRGREIIENILKMKRKKWLEENNIVSLLYLHGCWSSFSFYFLFLLCYMCCGCFFFFLQLFSFTFLWILFKMNNQHFSMCKIVSWLYYIVLLVFSFCIAMCKRVRITPAAAWWYMEY